MNSNMRKYKPDYEEACQRMTDWWNGKKVDRPLAYITAPKKNRTYKTKYINKAPDKYIDFNTVFNNVEHSFENTFYGGEAFPTHWIYFGPMFMQTIFYIKFTF